MINCLILLAICLITTSAFTLLHPTAGPQFPSTAPPRPARVDSQQLNAEPLIDNSNEDTDLLFGLSNEMTTGIYVHIPFCRRRCRYCDFAIVPVGLESDTSSPSNTSKSFEQLNENYTKALLREINLAEPSRYTSIKSIYFGGGTPSLAPIESIEHILQAIRRKFVVAADVEISIEMDPGTFTLEKAQALRRLGFNRVSLGIQSFDDRTLELLGRFHRYSDILNSLSILKRVFGEELNYSIDLISGLPGMSLEQWEKTLDTAVHLDPRPNHLSLYDLQIESGTVFARWYGNRELTSTASFHHTRGEPPYAVVPLPSEENCASMYKFSAAFLRDKSFEHYEVSSYALLEDSESTKPSRWRSRHNQIYWALDGQWYAFGMGATSYINGSLTERPRTMFDYLQWVDQNVGHFLEPPADDEKNLLMDVILKRLRTSEGLPLNWILKRFPVGGDSYVASIMKGARLGVELDLAMVENNTLCLRSPDGFLYSNSIISSIFAEFDC